ncbi:MAG TPA: hydroxymethylglutaryl-CoA lyase [Casimicrobiaceae bacterium]|jgi:hydroxymethylglutaryl-CoA lyase|nr:hydroxymethylglutaryl-CoA lyase [Casimicrobiaceae bacterium]
MTQRIYIHDVVARDGFQIEPSFIPTERKIEIIDLLSRTGVAKIEATSFVSPRAVPNLRDAEQVMAGIRRNPAVTYVALVPNARGAERALAAKVDEIVLVVSASETHNRANVRRSVAESFAGFREVFEVLRGSDIGVTGAIATAFGCPFEGAVPESQVLECVARYVDLGVAGVTFGDTTGVANPVQVERLSRSATRRFADLPLTLHFHNTRGMGLANVVAGLQAGVVRFEGCLGGLGGCPFAPGATGNVCTEDVVHMLECMGYDTGVDLDRLLAASRRLREIVGHELPGQVVKAGRASDLHAAPAET